MSGSCGNADALNSDKLEIPVRRAFYFEPEFNRLADARVKIIERPGLSMTTWQGGNGGDIETLIIPLYYDIKVVAQIVLASRS